MDLVNLWHRMLARRQIQKQRNEEVQEKSKLEYNLFNNGAIQERILESSGEIADSYNHSGMLIRGEKTPVSENSLDFLICMENILDELISASPHLAKLVDEFYQKLDEISDMEDTENNPELAQAMEGFMGEVDDLILGYAALHHYSLEKKWKRRQQEQNSEKKLTQIANFMNELEETHYGELVEQLSTKLSSPQMSRGMTAINSLKTSARNYGAQYEPVLDFLGREYPEDYRVGIKDLLKLHSYNRLGLNKKSEFLHMEMIADGIRFEVNLVNLLCLGVHLGKIKDSFESGSEVRVNEMMRVSFQWLDGFNLVKAYQKILANISADQSELLNKVINSYRFILAKLPGSFFINVRDKERLIQDLNKYYDDHNQSQQSRKKLITYF